MKNTGFFDTWITKNTVLVVSILYAGAVYFFEIKDAPAGCQAGWCLKFSSDLLLPLFLPAVIIAFFSLVTYFLPNQIFRAWIKFALAWAFVSGLWVVATPHDTGYALSLDQKPMLALSLSVLFFAISTLIILFRSIIFYWYKK